VANRDIDHTRVVGEPDGRYQLIVKLEFVLLVTAKLPELFKELVTLEFVSDT
jgi:hypothetical protein